jgi:hypothetical protein
VSEEVKPAAFEQFAIVELFGHQTLAGKVTEQVIAGTGFLRIDVPREDGSIVTRLQNPKSVYGIRPCTEEVARAAALRLYGIEPIAPVDFAKRLPEHDDDGDDYPEDPE